MIELITALSKHFKGDDVKVALWLTTENEALGGLTPIDMIKKGRIEKLLYFVNTSIESNYREGEMTKRELEELRKLFENSSKKYYIFINSFPEKDSDYVCAAANKTPDLLDHIENLEKEKHIWEETRRINKELSSDILRLRKALDKCKEQRNSLLGHSDGKLMMRGKYDSELNKILNNKGEVE
jgi:hypothetical protein